jgi:putative membrane protein
MRSLILIIASLYVLILGTGCAGPLGPPLGFGPGLDQLVFWGAIFIAGLVLWPRVQRHFRKNDGMPGTSRLSSSMEIIAERYAKGEINRDEYLRIINDLRL